MGVHFLVFLLP
jgi:hypothetical protein